MSPQDTDTQTAAPPTVVARADALLTRWEQRLRLAPARPATPSSIPPTAGKPAAGLLRPVAHGYVWLSATVARVATPVQQNWQQAVAEARQAQTQHAAQQGGSGAARRTRAKERQGEGKLKKDAVPTAEVAGTAAEVA